MHNLKQRSGYRLPVTFWVCLPFWMFRYIEGPLLWTSSYANQTFVDSKKKSYTTCERERRVVIEPIRKVYIANDRQYEPGPMGT